MSRQETGTRRQLYAITNMVRRWNPFCFLTLSHTCWIRHQLSRLPLTA